MQVLSVPRDTQDHVVWMAHLVIIQSGLEIDPGNQIRKVFCDPLKWHDQHRIGAQLLAQDGR